MTALKTMRRSRAVTEPVDAAALDIDRSGDADAFGAEPRDDRRHGVATQARGAWDAPGTDPASRGTARRNEGKDDGWSVLEMVPAAHPQVVYERSRAIIMRNEASDISFERVINPYQSQNPHRSQENGCARPIRAVTGTLDFHGGNRLFATAGAAQRLEEELAAPRYQAKTIAIGTEIDAYHPVERTERVTRSVLEVLAKANHPVGILTKSALVLRDLDLLAPMARKGLVKVAIAVTTLDPELARRLEPWASTPERRLHAIEELSNAGVPVTAMIAPIIPAINDAEIETILTRAYARGAREAGYVMLRLPSEVRALFEAWLLAHYPDKHRHVMTLVKSMSKGRAEAVGIRGARRHDLETRDAARTDGGDVAGPFAWMIGRRFEKAMARNGYANGGVKVRTDLFSRPAARGEQLSLSL